MSDLFKKLNTLLKASLHDALSGEPTPRGERRRPRPVDPAWLGKDIDREVDLLRSKINDAIAYEETLKSRASDLRAEIARLDQEADDAVSSGQHDLARHLIERMKRSEQRLAMTEADLREHRFVTQELIERVNVLESYVAEAKRADAERRTSAPDSPPETVSAVEKLSDMLRSARETIAGLSGQAESSQQAEADPSPPRGEPDRSVDDDLERRLKRLSKP